MMNSVFDVISASEAASQRGPPEEYSAALPPPFASHFGFSNAYAHAKSQAENAQKKQMFIQQQTMRPYIVHGPAPPILSLKPTTLREVAKRVNFIHQDRILFARTVHAPYRLTSTSLLIEDDNGDCLMFCLYNMVPDNADPDEYFPDGTYLCILAPYMKNSGDDRSRNLFLRCDNPECIRVFHTQREWKAAKMGKKLCDTRGIDPTKLRQEGNTEFSNGRHEAAARHYSRALEYPGISNEDRVACLSNLAEARLRQEMWEAAEESALGALKLDLTHLKARFRLATAQIRLNKLSEAQGTIHGRNERQFKNLARQIDCLRVEQQGSYDLIKLKREAKKVPGAVLSTFHADFTSPSIQQGVVITKLNGFAYRGSVARNAIQSNTLISSSKALVFSPGSMNLAIDPYTGSMNRGSSMNLETKLVSLMNRRSQIRQQVYSLAATSDGNKTDEGNKIDHERIRRLLASNTFSAGMDAEVEIEWERFKSSQRTIPNENNRDWILGSGLWLNESLFNHSCTPNCTWKQIGDQMFISTTKEVHPGEELTISYVSHLKSFQERNDVFRNWIEPGMGFCCQCDWCVMMRESTELQKVDSRIHAAFEKAAEMVSSDFVKMGVAANRAFPKTERKAALELLSVLPLTMQHVACAKLWIMEGSCRAHYDEDNQGALAAYKKAAEIRHAVIGECSIDRAKDLWRIVGASMACGKVDQALKTLCFIYRSHFAGAQLIDVNTAFRDLTFNYAMPWWVDEYDTATQNALEVLATRAIKEESDFKRRRLKSRSERARRS